ncbi:flagellar biosynthetic protein FliO [Aquabacter sp. CN5-332]|uniref:flagellar biosynthetic protein FliO n=1 Tax=Aquabacter sp. CN5-332 TaxID=3156608 RepID=UPI0032B43ECC
MLQDLLGTQLDLPVRVAIAAIVIVALLGLTVLIVRRLSGGGHGSGGRSRQARLAVLDSVAVDQRRRLVLVRRDDVEHLLLLGGAVDLVVEPGISRGLTRDAIAARDAVQRETTQLREPPAPREALPRRAAAPSLTPPAPSLTAPPPAAEPTPAPPEPAAPAAEPQSQPAEPAAPALEPRRPLTARRPLRPEGEAAPRPIRPVSLPERPARTPSSFTSSLRRVPATGEAKLAEAVAEPAPEPAVVAPAIEPMAPVAETPAPIPSVEAPEPVAAAPEPVATAPEPVAVAPEPVAPPQEPATPEVQEEPPARRIPMFSLSRPTRSAPPPEGRSEPQIGDMANRLDTALGQALETPVVPQPKRAEVAPAEAPPPPAPRLTPARFSPMMRATVPSMMTPAPAAPAAPPVEPPVAPAPASEPGVVVQDAIVSDTVVQVPDVGHHENDLVRELELTLARDAEAEEKARAEALVPETPVGEAAAPSQPAAPPPAEKPADKGDPFEDLEAEMATLLGRHPASRQ